jgi:hypothetical protein
MSEAAIVILFLEKLIIEPSAAFSSSVSESCLSCTSHMLELEGILFRVGLHFLDELVLLLEVFPESGYSTYL